MTEKEKILMSAWIETVDSLDRFWDRCIQILESHPDEISGRLGLVLLREGEALGEEIHALSFETSKEYACAGGDLDDLLENLEDVVEKQKAKEEQENADWESPIKGNHRPTTIQKGRCRENEQA